MTQEKVPARSPRTSYEEYPDTPTPPTETPHMFPPPPPENLNFGKPTAVVSGGPPHQNDIMSPNSAAISYIQNAHPAIDCPIVIPNGDYDPSKVNNDENRETVNGKRPHYDNPDLMSKKMKCKRFLRKVYILTFYTKLKNLHPLLKYSRSNQSYWTYD